MFTLDGYKVEFYHRRNLIDFNDEIHDVSFCNITYPDGSIYIQPVTRYYKDNPNYRKAREYAFTYALNTVFPGKENKATRGKFWKAYLDIVNTKPKKQLYVLTEYDSDQNVVGVFSTLDKVNSFIQTTYATTQQVTEEDNSILLFRNDNEFDYLCLEVKKVNLD